MNLRQIVFEPGFEGWKRAAREALRAGIPPRGILWEEQGGEQPVLNLSAGAIAGDTNSKVTVPKEFLLIAKTVALHSNPAKWPLLYSVVWRLTHGEEGLLGNPLDPAVLQLRHFEKEVKKDAYRMTAFLRFREVRTENGSWFVAWYEPEHDTVECNSDFFVDRFANMRWSILTPKRCMHWDGEKLGFTPGVTRASAPKEDEIEALWLAYYRNIFNPARLNPQAMQAQLLKRNWKNLPEALIIEPLLREAPRRTDFMLRQSAARAERTGDHSLARPPATNEHAELALAASHCRACPLWRSATCTVFGEGPPQARVMLVGEQPGDQEDRAGKPFVGPAGQVLASALAAAGLSRDEFYVTNAVKHFKWEPRGKRRLHQTPNSRDIASCRPWLAAEIGLLRPHLIVCLGATALHSVFEIAMPVGASRGQLLDSPFGIKALATVHPSSLLRMPNEAQRKLDFEKFVNDLKTIHDFR